MASSVGSSLGAIARAVAEDFQAQSGAFINFHHVDGNMLGRKRDRFRERVTPGLARLFRQPGDQVEADVANAGVAKDGDGAVNVRAAVHAACGFEFLVDEGLRAEADAIDAGGPLPAFSGSMVSGIGFERDFFPGAGEGLVNRAQQVPSSTGSRRLGVPPPM